VAIDDLQMEIQFQKVILKSIEDAPAENQAKARSDTVSEIKRLEKDLKRLRGGTNTTSSSQASIGSQLVNSSPAFQSSKSHTAPKSLGMLNAESGPLSVTVPSLLIHFHLWFITSFIFNVV